jgi:isoleucyl-tRNA synthetase
MMFEKPETVKLTELDKLFIDYLEDLTNKTEKAYEVYDFNHPAQDLRAFSGTFLHQIILSL